jgi:hypothetical protein
MEDIGLTIPYDSAFTHVLFNLAAQGFEYIKIQYSGGGDSGCIDDVYLVRQGAIKIEDGEVSENNDRDYADPDRKLRLLIEEKAYDRVLNNADDWYNNEGGGGTLYISTMDGTYHGDHYVNETTTHDSTLTGKFGDN